LAFSSIFAFTAFYFSSSFCFLYSVAEAAPVVEGNPDVGYFKPLEGTFKPEEDGSFLEISWV
jgi:hypothetical protein